MEGLFFVRVDMRPAFTQQLAVTDNDTPDKQPMQLSVSGDAPLFLNTF